MKINFSCSIEIIMEIILIKVQFCNEQYKPIYIYIYIYIYICVYNDELIMITNHLLSNVEVVAIYYATGRCMYKALLSHNRSIVISNGTDLLQELR
jgi:hypothetical protein